MLLMFFGLSAVLLGITIWTQGGMPLIDGSGNPIVCDDCPCGPSTTPCLQCSGETPTELIVSTSGVGTQVGSDCEECDTWNQAWIVPWVEIEESCMWELPIEVICGDPDEPPHYVQVLLYYSAGVSTKLRVLFRDDNFQTAEFEATWSYDDLIVDCTDFEAVLIGFGQDGTIPYVTQSTTHCDFEDAVVIVTS